MVNLGVLLMDMLMFEGGRGRKTFVRKVLSLEIMANAKSEKNEKKHLQIREAPNRIFYRLFMSGDFQCLTS